MRPQGLARITLAEGLTAGPGKTRDLAQRTGLAVEAARRVLDDMRKAGAVVVIAAERVPGVRRPLPVYDLAERHRPVPCASWGLLHQWAFSQAVA